MGEWGTWSSCTDSCSARDGTGDQTRTRSPDVNALNGGVDCTDPTSEDQSCDTVCPGKNALCGCLVSRDFMAEPQFQNS